MTDGSLVEWHLKEGDPVAAGDAMYSVETDKATMDQESVDDGILAKILIPDGTSNIPINKVVGLIVEEGQDWKDVEIPDDLDEASSSTPAKEEKSDVTSKSETSSSGRKLTSSGVLFPSVNRLFNIYGLSASDVTPTGPKNNILKGDVLKYIKKNGLKPSKPKEQSSKPVKSSKPDKKPASDDNEYSDIATSNMRSVIAKRLTESKYGIPHVYIAQECNLDRLLEFRKSMNGMLDVKLSVNDIIIKAVASTLKQVPSVNVSWSGEEIIQNHDIDVCFAVAIEGGLITPIIKDADKKGLVDINANVKDLAGRAKVMKLDPQEYQGGSFTISNLGMFGIKQFSAVINPPQGAILTIGGPEQGVKLVDGQPEAVTNITVQLSYDARCIGDESAAEFLSELKKVVEQPYLLIK
eukprot:TRINITY_DN7476_c0_g1_i1.p1 TRINITY_DN7476_c0_g1~~TRINITY_DN7476_c0_g1_i1.p1  ORF type:complete len:473 (-),score=128.97 TRINITY_DN7476_c0_g1_i1:22-1248(-)